MTTLTVLGSGSRGNAVAIASEGRVLLVDAGFSAKELHRRAVLAGVDLGALCGIALTHEHHDHARGALRLARHAGVPVLASPGTWSALRGLGRPSFAAVRAGGRTECGPFTLAGCTILHDAVEPLALTVTAGDGVTVGIAYDFGRPTQALRFHFRELHAVIVEANYDEVMLRTSQYPVAVQHRIAGSGGHLSNRATAQFLDELYQPALDTVVLAHLSQQCNAPEVARQAVEPVLRARGFRGELHVAEQETPLPPITLRPDRTGNDTHQGELHLSRPG
ncbi:MAG TPA: MBL fold metallo-hydrolase [Gemmatimonadales bacterium]|nr:MBL fold metallo-hydrolase [Gemmatimonadales bacterium]